MHEKLNTNEPDLNTKEPDFADIRELKTEEMENVSGGEIPAGCKLTVVWVRGVGPVAKIVC